jgi:hypothetical protein
MGIQLRNNAVGFLTAPIGSSDTSITLQTGNGAKFPALGGSDYFYATLSGTDGSSEIVKATARTGDTLTVVRAQEGTAVASFSAGSRMELRVTAASVRDLVEEHDEAVEISVADVGGYFAATNVEGVLQEIGAGGGSFGAFTFVDNFTGNGTTTVFTLGRAPIAQNLIDVYINGVYQEKTSFSFLGTTLTFLVAPPLGAGVEVVTNANITSGAISSLNVLYEPATGPTTNVETRLREYEDDGGSALIGFEPAGSGAVARPTQDKLRDVVSVKDFGAVGDGMTNDTAAIQAAIDAVEAAGGGSLYFPTGTYLTSGAHTVTAAIRFFGDNSTSCVIRLSGSNTGTNLFVLGSNSGDSSFVDLRLRGNWDGVTAPTAWGHGISQSDIVSQIKVFNCVVTNFTGSAIKFSGGIKNEIENTSLQNCGLDALWLDARTFPITNLTVKGGAFQNMRRSLWRCEGTTANPISGIRFVGVAMFISPICGRISGTNGGQNIAMTNCYVEDITNTAFWISANAPLDAENAGGTAAGTGDVFSVISNFFAPADTTGKVDLTSATYDWALSASGANEYYCTLAGGGNPSLDEPNAVNIRDTYRYKNSLGQLVPGQWGWGNNDTLGFSTVYVRLDDSVDPDTKGTNFVSAHKAWEIPSSSTSIRVINVTGNNDQFPRPSFASSAQYPIVFYDIQPNVPISYNNTFAIGREKPPEDSAQYLEMRAANGASELQRFQIFNDGVNGRAAILVGIGGNAPTEKIAIDSSSNVEITLGNVEILTASKGLVFSGGLVWRTGTGTPEGAVTAPVGSLFTRTDGGASTTLYVKESGSGNTGWVAK